MLPQLKIPKLNPQHVMQNFSEVYDWGLRDLNIPSIHKNTLGEGIKVAIIDSGKSQHFEVVENTVAAKNFSKMKSVDDKNGHSSACAGIIAARKNNQGIIGVAPKAKLYFAKAMDDSGSGNPAALANAVFWSMQQKVDIISISAGMFFDFKPLKIAIQRAYQQNIIIVCASGNSGTQNYDVAFPARYPECIGVAAYDKNRKVANFSSRGINVAFALPGVNIYTCYLNNQFVRLNGTSFSCPTMAGICALILAKHRKNQNSTPCNTPQEMLEHLKKYSVKLGPKNETGFGTIDLEKLFATD